MIGSKEAAEKYVHRADASCIITHLRQYFSLSPLQFLMNLKFKLAKGDPRLSMVQRTIWGVIR